MLQLLFSRRRQARKGVVPVTMMIIILSAVSFAAPRQTRAQPQYDVTVFQHGFNGHASSWLVHGSPELIGNRVSLGRHDYSATETASLDAVDAQVAQLKSQLRTLGGDRFVIVGHSLGGILARRIALDGGFPIAGIVTAGTPHQGMPLANNALAAKALFAGIKQKANDCKTAATFELGSLVLGILSSPFGIGQSTLNSGQDAAGVFPADAQGVADLRPELPSIQALQRGDNVPHANVYGTIPFTHAPLQVMATFVLGNDDLYPELVAEVDGAIDMANFLSWGSWFTLSWGAAVACGDLADALGSIDYSWASLVNPANPYAPSDGVIPNDHQVYPGIALSDPRLSFNVPGANHGQLTYVPGAIDALSHAMLAIGMQPGPGVAISGPLGTPRPGVVTWTATLADLSRPYTISWYLSYDGVTYYGISNATTLTRYANLGDHYWLRVTAQSDIGRGTVGLEFTAGPLNPPPPPIAPPTAPPSPPPPCTPPDFSVSAASSEGTSTTHSAALGARSVIAPQQPNAAIGAATTDSRLVGPRLVVAKPCG